jgi:hypothetical protein
MEIKSAIRQIRKFSVNISSILDQIEERITGLENKEDVLEH